MKYSRILCTLLSLLISISGITGYTATPIVSVKADKPTEQTAFDETHRIIVKFKNQKKSAASKSAITKKLKGLNFKQHNDLSSVDVLQFSQKSEFDFALQELQSDGNIEYAQPDYKLYKSSYPSDPDFNKQWGLLNNGQLIEDSYGKSGVDINISSVWDRISARNDILVGVLDSGIDINHEDLKNSIYKNTIENIDGHDNDKNGYIDDVNGWDFINSDNSVYDGYEDLHGTHIAGIIAASANSIGIRGVASGIRVVPLKFMNSEYGYTSDAIEAIEYAKKMGIKILNCSWGDYHYNYALEEEMKNSDILFVCSAGNDSNDLDKVPVYPAGYKIPNVITVGAVDNKGNLAKFSNYGSRVDIAAPGVSIYSTFPENRYDYLNGTSMSSPFISGTAALLLSVRQDLHTQDLAAIIKSSVKKLDSLSGKVKSGGIIDAMNAINNGINYIPSSTPTCTSTMTQTPTSIPYLTSPTPSNPSPVSGIWNEKSAMNYGRKDFSAVTIGGKIYVVGWNQKSECYDPDSNKWTEVSSVPSEIPVRRKQTLAVALKDKIYILGPNNSDKVYQFDPITGENFEKAALPFKIANSAAVSYDGKIYLSGGKEGSSTNNFIVYDPDKNSWSELQGMKKSRSYHCLVSAGNKIFALGGIEYPGSVEEYDVLANEWRELSSAPIEIYSMSSVVVNNKIFVLGSAQSNKNNFYEFNTNKGTWLEKERMPTDRDSLSAVALNGTIFAIGGTDDQGKNNIVEQYVFATNTPTVSATPQSPTPASLTPVSETPTPTPSTTVANNQGGRLVSGKVYIDRNLLKKDLSIEVYAETDKDIGTGAGKGYSTNITLKKDTGMSAYSLIIPQYALNNSFRIGYSITNDSENVFAKTAYYHPSGSVIDTAFASKITVGSSDMAEIDLDLLIKRKISGTVYLPNGNRAPKGGVEADLSLTFLDNAFLDIKSIPEYLYNKTITIPEGQNSTTYSFTIFENNKSSKYILSYVTNAEGCLQKGYYSPSGIKNNNGEAGLIDISEYDANNIDMTFLLVKSISGILSLPNNERAPAGGLLIIVAAENDSDRPFMNHFTIPEGSNSVRYFINLPNSTSNDYVVDYYTNKKGYISLGYYSYGSTSYSRNNVSIVNTGNGSRSDVNLTIIKGRVVSGNIYLPNNRLAPSGGIDIDVRAYIDSNTDDFSLLDSVTIPANSNSIDYTLTVPFELGFYLDYSTDAEGFVSEIFYSKNYDDSTFCYADRRIFAASYSDMTNYNIRLVEGCLVNISLNLPDGYVASKDIKTLVSFSNINTQVDGPDYFIKIAKNSSKTVNKIYVPSGSYLLYYINPSYSENGYEPIGYYGVSGTTNDENRISTVNISPNNQNTFTLTLIPGPNLPPSVTATPAVQFPAGAGGQVSTVVRTSATPVPVSSLSPSSVVVTSQKPDDKIPASNIFTDITNHWAKDNILKLVTKGIIEGYPDKTIKPDNSITRAEITKIISAMLGYAPTQDADLKFADKSKIPSWASGYIDILNKKAIITGYKDNTFKPSKYVTRKEMAVIIIKALGLKNVKATNNIQSLKDFKSIPAWASDYVSKCLELGLINGYSDKTFGPDKNIKRAEVFTIIAKALE